MDLLTLIRVVLRRWYVALPIILASMGAAWWVQSNTPPTYEATGSILLASPELDPSRIPFVVADVGARVSELDEPEVLQQLAEQDASFAVEPVDTTTLTIRAVGEAPEAAAETVENVVSWLRTEIEASQTASTIPADERVEVRTLHPVVVPEEQDDGSFRAEATVLFIDPTAGTVNPYGPTASTGRLLEVSLESDSGVERIEAQAADGIEYDVDQYSRDAPILTVTVLGHDPGGVIEAFTIIHGELGADLERRQARAEVPSSRRVTTEVIAAPEFVEDVSPPVERSAAVFLAVGGLLAIGLALLVENIAARGSYSARRRPEDSNGSGQYDRINLGPRSAPKSGEPPRSEQTEAARSTTGPRRG